MPWQPMQPDVMNLVLPCGDGRVILIVGQQPVRNCGSAVFTGDRAERGHHAHAAVLDTLQHGFAGTAVQPVIVGEVGEANGTACIRAVAGCAEVVEGVFTQRHGLRVAGQLFDVDASNCA